MSNPYDLIVIGAGPGGYVAAIKAAQLGKNVAVIEKREIGGTCLNRGCIPTKVFAHAAQLYHEMKTCDALGIHAGEITYDAAQLYARKNEVAAQLRTGVEKLLKANKIDLIRGAAEICAPGRVRVAETEYAADKILIAAGSLPARPPIPGLELPHVVTSDELLTEENRFYQRLVIIGGGVIGMEFATIYSAFGCDVTVIEAMDRILPTMDREIAQNLAMILKKRGVTMHAGGRVEKIEQADGALLCRFTVKDQKRIATADGILVSVGRRANTAGLTGAGIDLGYDRGQIPVDAHFETRVKGIYAIGDVVHGGIQLAHVASAQGANAVAAMFGQEPPVNLEAIPACIYTQPEIAAVGITADQAKEMGISVKTGKFIMSANGKSIIEMAERGFIKVVFDAETEVILGAQMMCSRATDLIGELVTAVANRLTLRQMAAVMRPHPTFNEAVTEAAEDVHGFAVHAAPRKKV